MRVGTLLFLGPLLSLSSASALGAQDAQALARGVAAPGTPATPLAPRDDCKRNGCKCQKVDQGQYCGLCQLGGGDVVTSKGSGGANSHVYECNRDGGCCDYGRSDDCASGKRMRCGDKRQDAPCPPHIPRSECY